MIYYNPKSIEQNRLNEGTNSNIEKNASHIGNYPIVTMGSFDHIITFLETNLQVQSEYCTQES